MRIKEVDDAVRALKRFNEGDPDIMFAITTLNKLGEELFNLNEANILLQRNVVNLQKKVKHHSCQYASLLAVMTKIKRGKEKITSGVF